ncbi:hypothetical protein [Peribacillus deserti]|uniref:hypothetical protein n=1 Tax=Peribacillus deserti TaxID=673318 RepID=UPI0015E06C32|nr:hypothetical protein [Peribacillus deserti]
MSKNKGNKYSNNRFYDTVIKTIGIYKDAINNDANWTPEERDIIDRLVDIQLDYFSVHSLQLDDKSLIHFHLGL